MKITIEEKDGIFDMKGEDIESPLLMLTMLTVAIQSVQQQIIENSNLIIKPNSGGGLSRVH